MKLHDSQANECVSCNPLARRACLTGGVRVRFGHRCESSSYEELGRLARRELECAVGVLVDATFRRAADRAAFLAGLGGLPAASVFVECRAPLSVRLERARRRLGDAAAVSDADVDVVRLQADDGGLADDVPADRHLVLRTDRPAAEALDDLAALLDARLARDDP